MAAQMKSIRTQPRPAAFTRSSWAASSAPCGAWMLTPNEPESAAAPRAWENRTDRRTRTPRGRRDFSGSFIEQTFFVTAFIRDRFSLRVIYNNRLGSEVHSGCACAADPGGGIVAMQFRELTDRYQLEKILKSNRFGTVLRAVDSKSGRPVVVKLITVSSPPRLVAAAPEFARLAA